MTQIFDPGKGARKEARTAQAAQEKLIQEQKQASEQQLATEEDVIARKKLAGATGRAGRRSLIKTSETGVKSTNLGGNV
jgi:hypothetical protein